MVSAERLRLFFSFRGRLSRLLFIKLFGVLLLAHLVILVVGMTPRMTTDPVLLALSLIVFVPGLLAVYISLASISVRRCRDLGAPAALGIITCVYAALCLFGLVPALTVLGLLLNLICYAAAPAWDASGGVTHIVAMMRRIAIADGAPSENEKKAMYAVIGQRFAIEAKEQLKLLNQFETGHQDYETLAGHIQGVKAQQDEDGRRVAVEMMMNVACADGPPSSAKMRIIDEILAGLKLSSVLPPTVEWSIAAAAKMCKADGRVEPAQIKLIERFIDDELKLPAPFRKAAIERFRAAKDSAENFGHCISQLCDALDEAGAGGPQQREYKKTLFALLLHLAAADGEMHPKETEYLEFASRRFGFEDGAGAQDEKSSGADEEAPSSQEGPLDAKFAKVLGVSASASADEIKTAYREQMNKNHPDKVAHLSDAIKTLALEETKKIQEAYEHFKNAGRA